VKLYLHQRPPFLPYSLEIKNLQVREMEPIEDQSELPPNARGKNGPDPKQGTLFALPGAKGGKKNA
jgi:hypothetical protein